MPLATRPKLILCIQPTYSNVELLLGENVVEDSFSCADNIFKNLAIDVQLLFLRTFRHVEYPKRSVLKCWPVVQSRFTLLSKTSRGGQYCRRSANSHVHMWSPSLLLHFRGNVEDIRQGSSTQVFCKQIPYDFFLTSLWNTVMRSQTCQPIPCVTHTVTQVNIRSLGPFSRWLRRRGYVELKLPLPHVPFS